MRPEHRWHFVIPNVITTAGLWCGLESIRLSSEATDAGAFPRAALFVVFAMCADILDGRVARATGTQSAFGMQLDSLADVVAFGVAPALLVYRWSLHQLGMLGAAVSFLYVACGAIRLARFNVLSSAKSPTAAPSTPRYILGLPIPGAAGLVVSLVLSEGARWAPGKSPEFVLAIALLMSALMISTLRFRSFKQLRPTFATAVGSGFLLLTCGLVLAFLGPPFVLLWLLASYVAVALFEWLVLATRPLEPKPTS